MILLGEVVISLHIPGRKNVLSGMNTSELVSALKSNQDEENRVLIVSEPRIEGAIPPSKYARPGGTWYMQAYTGPKSTACKLLVSGGDLTSGLDKRYVYVEPYPGRMFSVDGRLASGQDIRHNLLALPEGAIDPMRLEPNSRIPKEKVWKRAHRTPPSQ